MIEKIIVVDSSPLIILAKVNKFHFLKKFFGKIYIPEAVYEEVVIKGQKRAGSIETKKALGVWIKKEQIKNYLAVEVLLSDLHRGEAEAIILTKELKAAKLIIDDYEANAVAKSLSLNTIGTLDIILTGYKAGLIKNLKIALHELREKGFYLDDEVYNNILSNNSL